MFRKGRAWKRWLLITLVAVLVAAGGGYYYLTGQSAVAQNVQQESVKTASVRRGDLTLSATGAGVVVPVDEVEVGFAVDGTLTEVAVTVGDEVGEGDVLARIDDLDLRQALASAQQQVVKAKIDMQAAQEAAAELEEKAGDAEVLEAKATLATAQQALADLQEACHDGRGRRGQGSGLHGPRGVQQPEKRPHSDRDTERRAQGIPGQEQPVGSAGQPRRHQGQRQRQRGGQGWRRGPGAECRDRGNASADGPRRTQGASHGVRVAGCLGQGAPGAGRAGQAPGGPHRGRTGHGASERGQGPGHLG